MQTVSEVAPLTDSSPMPFGKYIRKRLIDIPAPYFLWLRGEGCSHPGVRKYINDNLDALILEAEKIPRR